MHVEEMVKGVQLVAADVFTRRREALFSMYENCGVFAQLLAGSGMVLKKFVQLRMVIEKIFVNHKRRIALQHASDIRVCVQKIIKAFRVCAVDRRAFRRGCQLLCVSGGGKYREDPGDYQCTC